MIETAANRPLLRHWMLWLVLLASAALIIWLVSICFGIVAGASRQEIHSADAIAVFGAADTPAVHLPCIERVSIMPLTCFNEGLLRWSLQPAEPQRTPASAKVGWATII